MQPTLLTGLRCSHRSPLCQDPEYGETSILAIEPVALKKELKNATGALIDCDRYRDECQADYYQALGEDEQAAILRARARGE